MQERYVADVEPKDGYADGGSQSSLAIEDLKPLTHEEYNALYPRPKKKRHAPSKVAKAPEPEPEPEPVRQSLSLTRDMCVQTLTAEAFCAQEPEPEPEQQPEVAAPAPATVFDDLAGMVKEATHDDSEAALAATKIQARVRGRNSRRYGKGGREAALAAAKSRVAAAEAAYAKEEAEAVAAEAAHAKEEAEVSPSAQLPEAAVSDSLTPSAFCSRLFSRSKGSAQTAD